MPNPPTTGSAELNSFLVDVKNAINTAAKPLAGWKLSDFEAGVSEVISDKRDLIDIVTAWDDLVNIRNNFETEVARYETLYSDSKVLGNEYQEYANTFSQIMEWWDQNVRLIEDIEEFMIEVNADTSAAADARDQAVTAKNAAVAAQTAAEAAAAAAGEAGGGVSEVTAADITDATTVGRNVLKAATTAAARTAIGAGTSNLAIGTTAGTAKAGDWKPTAADITDLPPIRSAAVADSLVLRSPTGNVLVADTPSGPSSATSRTYVETYVASQLGQAGSTIVPVEALPANPDPTTFYAVMGPGAVPEPTALATYQMVGTPTAGQDFPGTAVPSSFGFASNPGGWSAGASHGLTPPVAGLYTIKVTASPANGPVTIYPYVGGAWGTSIVGTGDTATAALQLTTSDAVYYDVLPTTGGVPVTITVKMYAGVV